MNRNKIIALNGLIATLTTILNSIFGLVEVSLFINYYGSIINGLIQTGNQVLNYVILIESGLGAAFLYKMYKPIAENDYSKLSRLYVGFRKSMSKVVNYMIIVAIVISVVYPLLIKTSDIGYFNMFTIFLLLSLKVILPYKVTLVPKYMLVVKEKKHYAEFISGISRSCIYLIEIIIIIIATTWNIKIPIQVLLLVVIVISLLTGFWYEISMRKIYNNLINKSVEADITPNTMSKDILVHNVSRMVFNSTDNIIISTLGSLGDVTIYSSYNMIIGQVMELIQKIMDGVTATLGIKIANHDKNSYDIYREMISGSLWLAGIICSVFILVMNDFVELWIGSQYCVSNISLFLFSLVLYSGIILPCIQVARNACGLYKESRNFTAIQAALNLVVTLLLVPSCGITGALTGTVLSRLLITIPCNYLLVANKVFAEEKSKICELVVGLILLCTIAFFGLNLTQIFIGIQISKGLFFVLKTLFVTVLAGLFYTAFYWGVNSGFREFINRIMRIFLRKKDL